MNINPISFRNNQSFKGYLQLDSHTIVDPAGITDIQPDGRAPQKSSIIFYDTNSKWRQVDFPVGTVFAAYNAAINATNKEFRAKLY